VRGCDLPLRSEYYQRGRWGIETGFFWTAFRSHNPEPGGAAPPCSRVKVQGFKPGCDLATPPPYSLALGSCAPSVSLPGCP